MAKSDRVDGPDIGPRPPLGSWARRTLDWVDTCRAGIILATTITLASSFLADHYAAPAMLFAGYSVSETAGDIATFTKLLRVALLPGVLLAVAVIFRKEAGGSAGLP